MCFLSYKNYHHNFDTAEIIFNNLLIQKLSLGIGWFKVKLLFLNIFL